MEFGNLTKDNLVLYAVKAYENDTGMTLDEFREDFDRIKYVKRLLRKYVLTGQIKERLVLNHLVTLYNVFQPEALTRILFFRFDEDMYPALKTFLSYLSFMPDVVPGINGTFIRSVDVPLDSSLQSDLQKL
jgi:hypothetical protein